MVRLQPVLSKPNWQSRRPHNPYSPYPICCRCYYSRRFYHLCPSTRTRVINHAYYHACQRWKQTRSSQKERKNGAHTYPSVRMEMLDRRRPSFSSPPPPVCLSLLSSPHDFCKHSRPCTNLAFDSLADTSCLVTRPVIR